MSVCVAAEYPWFNIRHLRGLELPGVAVLSDTRVTSSRGTIHPWVAAKQKPLKRSIFVCYTSSNVAVTLHALRQALSRRDVKAIGRSLREAHERYGGVAELLTVVWTRKLPPQLLELMPPDYAPRRRRGIVGIGDRAVLAWLQENFPDPSLRVAESQDLMEALREASAGKIEVVKPHYGIEQAAVSIVAAFSEAIRLAGGQSVGLPVQLAVINGGTARPVDLHMTKDLGSWEEVAVLPHKTNLPNLPLAYGEVDLTPRTAVQLFGAN